MSPSLMLDNESDFNPIAATTPNTTRTLLLAPPSISSHEETLKNVLATHDRSSTDLQMLDRLSAGFVTLPYSTYDLILILTDADGTRTESSQLLGRDVFTRIVSAMKTGGKLEAQDGTFGQQVGGDEHRESILAGLVAEGGGMVKPDYSASVAMPLKLRRKEKVVPTAAPAPAVSVPVTQVEVKPAGVGFVDFSDDFDDPMITGEDDDDDELIDEDTLLTEEDLKRPAQIPPECVPRVGKRRRACKDCTCGLAQKLQAEDAAKRASADEALKTLKLGSDDLAEVDFTIQGKVGSCGNCSLGDAFRCDGCPYIGMPAFKPGEEVRLLNNDVQL
ncbi:hypothetical protein HYALB_00007377 [Hymenoscyphus albidus]|uniref:Fe-S cluster assembly protein DRE2 n=1 Tax=Hymenoscyphus albidus TaxID=595503 RepID=A0A9N9LKW2_9HELO|nr:hypothetical protein HYALB_00007377 [Hymenoscyphus albidus]